MKYPEAPSLVGDRAELRMLRVLDQPDRLASFEVFSQSRVSHRLLLDAHAGQPPLGQSVVPTDREPTAAHLRKDGLVICAQEGPQPGDRWPDGLVKQFRELLRRQRDARRTRSL